MILLNFINSLTILAEKKYYQLLNFLQQQVIMYQLYSQFSKKLLEMVDKLLDSQQFSNTDNQKMISLSRLKIGSQIDYRYVLLKNNEYIYQTYTKGDIKKPHILLLHGFGATSLNNIRIIQHLHNFFQVHSIDMLGVGLSSRDGYNDEFTHQEVINYFIDSIEQWRIKINIDRFVLLGHSFGGYLSSLYFSRYPQRVSKLILVSPPGTSILTDQQFSQKVKGKQLKYFLGEKIFNLKIKPSRVMNTPIIGRLVYRLLFDQTRVSHTERPICTRYLILINSCKNSSELGFYKLFQWPLKPKKSIQQILTETNPDYPIPINFYFGDQDYMPSEGAYRLAQQFQNISVDVITDSGHQILFQNPAQLTQKILTPFINPSNSYFSQKYYNIVDTISKDYAKPNNLKAFKAFSLSIILFLFANYIANNISEVVGSFLLTLTVVRIFIQFHDMAHLSFFQSFQLNYTIGKIIGVLTHYPFDQWKARHNKHHQISGNLDEKDPQSSLLTKDEYQRCSPLQKIWIRLLRQPIIFYLITSQIFWVFLVLIEIIKEKGIRSSAFFQKILSFVLYFYILDYSWYLRLHCALIIGHLLFHFQHTVNQPYAKHKEEWRHQKASIEGSTFLQIPSLLKIFTNGIQYHHIHHLKTNIPSYSIQQCHEQCSIRMDWNKLNLKKVDMKIFFSNLTNVLYNKSQNRFEPFPSFF